jgi:hypothetical protein
MLGGDQPRPAAKKRKGKDSDGEGAVTKNSKTKVSDDAPVEDEKDAKLGEAAGAGSPEQPRRFSET